MGDELHIKIVGTEEEFDALEIPWNRLSEKTSASIFSSFDYVRTAWRHFHEPADKLLVLVLSDGSSIVGIAPFYIARCHRRGIPYRALRFIAVWEGDRPGILTELKEEACWNHIISFLVEEFRAWDVLELVEEPAEGPQGRGWSFLSRAELYWEKGPDIVDYYISLKGSWEEYLKGLGSKTRANWRRQMRRLSSITEGYAVESISEPERMKKAFSRFAVLERLGWKAQAGIGASKNKRHRAFYEDLLVILAGKGQVKVHFLRSEGEDIAGSIIFVQRGILYGRQTAFAPSHAKYSPGLLLHAEIFREHFGGAHKEFDLLGIREEGKYKTHWATGRRETVHWTAYRLRSRVWPLILAKRFKRLLFIISQKKVARREPVV